MTGLVIDDFFSLSAELVKGARGDHYEGPNMSRTIFERAKTAYAEQKTLVSDDKEVADSLKYKVIGAEVVSSEELLILACLGPLAASNIAVPFSDMVYASDSSATKGGLVATEVAPAMSRVLWRTAAKKAKNPMFPSRTAALHRIKDASFEEVDDGHVWDDPEEEVPRPLGFDFDFVKLCGGAGVVTKELARMSYAVGPVFDLSYSRQYDITDRRVFCWLALVLPSLRRLIPVFEPTRSLWV